MKHPDNEVLSGQNTLPAKGRVLIMKVKGVLTWMQSLPGRLVTLATAGLPRGRFAALQPFWAKLLPGGPAA